MPARGAHAVRIDVGAATIAGDLVVPAHMRGLVLFAHGSGSSRHSTRNRFVARALQDARFATLLLDLLTPAEDAVHEHRFDVGLLAKRLEAAIDWAENDDRPRSLPVGLFGASTGAAAALTVAALRPERVGAVVSRGGRPDLAPLSCLEHVKAPTLLIVGGADMRVLELNESVRSRLHADLAIVPGATHLFEEPGALEHVAKLAVAWFERWLPEP